MSECVCVCVCVSECVCVCERERERQRDREMLLFTVKTCIVVFVPSQDRSYFSPTWGMKL